MTRKFKWTIEFEVDEIWVADGFDLSADDAARIMLENVLPFANEYEFNAKVICKPYKSDIRKCQGY